MALARALRLRTEPDGGDNGQLCRQMRECPYIAAVDLDPAATSSGEGGRHRCHYCYFRNTFIASTGDADVAGGTRAPP